MEFLLRVEQGLLKINKQFRVTKIKYSYREPWNYNWNMLHELSHQPSELIGNAFLNVEYSDGKFHLKHSTTNHFVLRKEAKEEPYEHASYKNARLMGFQSITELGCHYSSGVSSFFLYGRVTDSTGIGWAFTYSVGYVYVKTPCCNITDKQQTNTLAAA